jgi:hypothetical protein
LSEGRRRESGGEAGIDFMGLRFGQKLFGHIFIQKQDI